VTMAARHYPDFISSGPPKELTGLRKPKSDQDARNVNVLGKKRTGKWEIDLDIRKFLDSIR